MFQNIVDFFPHTAHLTAHTLLSIYSQITREHYKKPPEWRPVQWKNLYFPNPLSPAGGMDKNGCHLPAWWSLGAGFIEVGTVTPLPQKKHTGVTLKRSYRQRTLWNHLGFPNDGVMAVQKRLKRWKNLRPTPVFANIGKNRHTPHEKAEEDYLKCISQLFPYVDAFVINISSPNTPDLTKLYAPSRLKAFLKEIQKTLNCLDSKKPFLIKWGPDTNPADFLRSVDIALACGVEGHIIGNSMQGRPAPPWGQACLPFGRSWPAYGGLSGAPLANPSQHRLKLIQNHLGERRKEQLLISVGGVLKVEDVFERLNLGADLVQAYSALVFKGPFFLRQASKKSSSLRSHSAR